MRWPAHLVALLSFTIAGCAGKSPPPEMPTERSVAERPADHDGSTKERALLGCHLTRTDYQQVADTVCPDGTKPLRGDLGAANRARSGNVGPGPDHHIVDAYTVPCTTPIELFVDGYHCPPGMEPEVQFDIKNPTPAQLVTMGKALEKIAGMGPGQRANGLRKQAAQLLETIPVTIEVCGNFLKPLIADKTYKASRLLVLQLVISTGAEVLLRGGGPADRAGVELGAAEGVLRLYDSILVADPTAHHPHLDLLLQLRDGNKLKAYIDAGICRPGT